MEKIKSPAKLVSEKRSLEKKKAELELAIRRDWTELRKHTRLHRFIINSFSGWVDKIKSVWR
jgi:hypothetical protein